ncbi:hypothetical protein GNF00_18385, partial [Klebsiella pneumoniae]|nr:hypothetical protein [Klebsiella pneumoniae]
RPLNKTKGCLIANFATVPIIFPYGWEKKQLTREMRRMFPRKTGRRVLIMLDELHHFSDLREKP